MSSSKKFYRVIHAQYKQGLVDPDLPQPRFHDVIFVETDDDRGGYVHHVTGDITSGMVYQRKKARYPANSDSFHSMETLGWVEAATYPQVIHDILRNLPPPGRQKTFNPKTYKTEPVKDDGTFYLPGEPRKRLRKCTEWTLEQAIPALMQNCLRATPGA